MIAACSNTDHTGEWHEEEGGRKLKENNARSSKGPFLFRFIGMQRVKDKDLTPPPPLL